MDLHAVRFATVRAGQAVGMEQADKVVVAGHFIHQVVEREIHARLVLDYSGTSFQTSSTDEKARVKGLITNFPT
jgi:CRISPR/Cas system-associated exonuclease Cas4 (RecB family)